MWGEGYEIERWRESGLLRIGDWGRAKEVTFKLNEEGASHEALEWGNIPSRRQNEYEGLEGRIGLVCLRSSKSNCVLEPVESCGVGTLRDLSYNQCHIKRFVSQSHSFRFYLNLIGFPRFIFLNVRHSNVEPWLNGRQ